MLGPSYDWKKRMHGNINPSIRLEKIQQEATARRLVQQCSRSRPETGGNNHTTTSISAIVVNIMNECSFSLTHLGISYKCHARANTTQVMALNLIANKPNEDLV